MTSQADFDINAGERVPFVLNYRPSDEPAQPSIDAEHALAETERHWLAWSQRCSFKDRWREPVMRSLLTLKALIYQPTGGIVAAPTTSLPEQPGSPSCRMPGESRVPCWTSWAAFGTSPMKAFGRCVDRDATSPTPR
jgi:GH15 family glucan-1,4-alpha-glucosidase